MAKQTVAIVGASNDRHKFGNKAVRAYLAEGYIVYPVNLSESHIEGQPAFRSLLDIQDDIGRVCLYLQPEKSLTILDEIGRKGVSEVFFNPGTSSPEVISRAQTLGINAILDCAILYIGRSPTEFP